MIRKRKIQFSYLACIAMTSFLWSSNPLHAQSQSAITNISEGQNVVQINGLPILNVIQNCPDPTTLSAVLTNTTTGASVQIPNIHSSQNTLYVGCPNPGAANEIHITRFVVPLGFPIISSHNYEFCVSCNGGTPECASGTATSNDMDLTINPGTCSDSAMLIFDYKETIFLSGSVLSATSGTTFSNVKINGNLVDSVALANYFPAASSPMPPNTAWNGVDLTVSAPVSSSDPSNKYQSRDIIEDNVSIEVTVTNQTQSVLGLGYVSAEWNTNDQGNPIKVSCMIDSLLTVVDLPIFGTVVPGDSVKLEKTQDFVSLYVNNVVIFQMPRELIFTSTNVGGTFTNLNGNSQIFPGDSVAWNLNNPIPNTTYWASILVGSSTFSQDFVMPAPPVFSSTSDNNGTLCPGDSNLLVIAPSGSTTFTPSSQQFYTMNAGQQTVVSSGSNTHFIDQSGTYYFSATDVNGCEVVDTIEIQASTLSPSISGPTILCPSASADLEAFGADSIVWIPSNINSSTYINASPGSYSAVFVESTSGCSDTTSITIANYADMNDSPLAFNDTINIFGDNLSGSVDVLLNDNYSSPVNTLILENSSANSVNMSGSIMEYSIPTAAKFSFGDEIPYQIEDATCPEIKDSAIVFINVQPIPQLITPAINDGKNDTWDIHMEPSEDIEVIVLNRWGDVIYQTVNYQNDWSGQCNTGILAGKTEAVSGTYYYVINFKELDKSIKGFIELVK